MCSAKEAGCYKVILDCAENNVAFYEKCGLTRKEVQMVWPPLNPFAKYVAAAPAYLLCLLSGRPEHTTYLWPCHITGT